MCGRGGATARMTAKVAREERVIVRMRATPMMAAQLQVGDCHPIAIYQVLRAKSLGLEPRVEP